MTRVRAIYDGSAVRLLEQVDWPGNTPVEVLFPEPSGKSLTNLLDDLDQRPIGERLSVEEVVTLIHEVREQAA